MVELKAKEKSKKKKPMFDFGEFLQYKHPYIKDKNAVLNNDVLVKSLVYYATTQKIQGTMEIMGWLAGRINGNTIEIVDCYVGNCNSSTYFTELDPLETVKMKNLAKQNGLVLVGQWHCHPGISTNPSSEDHDTLNTLKKFGIQNPAMLIVNDKDFWLGTIDSRNKLRQLEFIIPAKSNNTDLDLNIAYINGEYQEPQFHYDNTKINNDFEDEFAPLNMIGDWFLSVTKIFFYPIILALILFFKTMELLITGVEVTIDYFKMKQYKEDLKQAKQDFKDLFKKETYKDMFKVDNVKVKSNEVKPENVDNKTWSWW